MSKHERPLKRLYSIKEAAVYLGRSVCAVREMIWSGKLPYVKDGKRILLDIYTILMSGLRRIKQDLLIRMEV